MKAENRLSATTTLTVNVMDSDDLDPAFEHELYNAKVTTDGSLPSLPLPLPFHTVLRIGKPKSKQYDYDS